MVDKSWMLNPKTMRHAKACIDIIRQETGIKLKLSQPDFLQVLRQYVAELNSRPLLSAYNNLVAKSSISGLSQHQDTTDSLKASRMETVNYHGKDYPRWNQGKEFRGLYRGQPRYR